MSRIGKMPITIPAGVKVEIDGLHVKVQGPKGSLAREICPDVQVEKQGDTLICTPKGNSKKNMALWGLTRSLLNNMVTGVDQGFVKKLSVEGVGYRANVSGQTLTLNVGYSSGVEFALPANVSATVDKDNSITLQGVDKELIGQTAAQIRKIRGPEPYKGKGIRYADEYIMRKVGKAGGK
ncbi:MAG: 50S ribosomal protein L6 [Desulfobulbus sp.]|jgi:large subunit ribosomal protein L6